jgi:hypothetical protein
MTEQTRMTILNENLMKLLLERALMLKKMKKEKNLKQLEEIIERKRNLEANLAQTQMI